MKSIKEAQDVFTLLSRSGYQITGIELHDRTESTLMYVEIEIPNYASPSASPDSLSLQAP